MKHWLCLALLASLLSSPALAADKAPGKAPDPNDVIVPYGVFSWEDGIEGVIGKLGGIEGVRQVVLGSGVYPHSENIKGKAGRELRELIVKSYGRYTGEGAFANPALDSAQSFVNAAGARIPFHEAPPADVTVSPVVLCGVPFEMKLEFVHAPGLALRYPERILVAEDGANLYAIALVLRRVSLVAQGPIDPVKIAALKSMVLGRYARFKGGLSEGPETIWGKVEDARGTIFSVDVGKANGLLSWSSRWFERQLAEGYRRSAAGAEGAGAAPPAGR